MADSLGAGELAREIARVRDEVLPIAEQNRGPAARIRAQIAEAEKALASNDDAAIAHAYELLRGW